MSERVRRYREGIREDGADECDTRGVCSCGRRSSRVTVRCYTSSVHQGEKQQDVSAVILHLKLR